MSRGTAAAVAGLLTRRATLLAVLLALTFLAVTVLPTDAAEATLGSEASPTEVAAHRAQLGLDRPVAERFLDWVGGLATGDLGVSARGRPIGEIVGQHFGNTVVLGSIALAVTVLVSLMLGGISVLRPDRLVDRVVRATSMVALTVPEFVVANALIVVFAFWLHALPASTAVSHSGQPSSPTMLILPALALAIPLIGWNTQIVRGALVEQLPKPHVDSAIMDGLPSLRILIRYLLPGAVPTIAAGVATSVGMALGGAVAVETIFNFPGMGAVLIDAIRDRDAPLIAGVVTLTGAVITLVLVAADLLRSWATGVNP